MAIELVRKAQSLGCKTLVVTVDVPTGGKRTWDRRGYSSNLKLSFRSKLNVLLKLRWLVDVMLPYGLPKFENLNEFLPENERKVLDGARYMGRNINSQLNWEDISKLRNRWKGRLILKGLLHPEDVSSAVDCGIDGVVLSNHGGRQLDHCISPMDHLPEISKHFRDKISIFIDGGFRRGTDVTKAIALGAHGVFLGRAPLYGVSAGGKSGIRKVLDIFTDEMTRTLKLLGVTDIDDLSEANLMKLG